MRANEKRILQAQIALETEKDSYRQSEQENVTDMITNLTHFCDCKGVNFASCLLSATIHYDAEVLKEEGHP